MPEKKPFWKSKTLWVNMAVAAAGVFLDTAPDDIEWVALANMILRYYTSKGLGA